MFEDAAKALAQMLSPPFRAVLIKSAGLAIVLLIVVGIGVDRGLVWLVDRGGAWIELNVGSGVHMPVAALEWIVAVAAGLGLIAGIVFLMPAVTAIVASLFVDEIAGEVERSHYPGDPAGEPLPLGRALLEGIVAALVTIAVYLVTVPFLLVAGLGFVIFFLATAYVQGRIYFELAAMRFLAPTAAKAMRRLNRGTVFGAGILIAAFLSIPIVNLAAPLFGTALMVHVYKRLNRRESSTGAMNR